MIEQLRKKWTRMTMRFVCVVILLIFSFLCLQTYLHDQREIEQSLSWTLSLNPSKNERPGLPANTLIYNEYSHSFTVLGDERMALFDAADLIEQIEHAPYDTMFRIGSYQLKKKVVTNGYIVGIVDIDMLRSQWHALILRCLCASALILFVFWVAWNKMSLKIIAPVQEAWDAQKRFVADASHELKTPLTVLLVNSETLLEEDGDNALLQSIHSEAKRMQTLVLQLLELAKYEALPKVKKELFDLSSLLLQRVLEREASVFEEGIELLYAIDEGIWIEADPTDLAELITILLDNAQKYTKPKETITIHLTYADQRFFFSIQNSGIALSKEDQEHIFDRFYRSDRSRTGDGSYGLGLAIAKELAKRNDLVLGVRSQADTVTFFLEGKANRTTL